jgi:hypothetical protein
VVGDVFQGAGIAARRDQQDRGIAWHRGVGGSEQVVRHVTQVEAVLLVRLKLQPHNW